MPRAFKERGGISIVTLEGDYWQELKLADLVTTFGRSSVVENPERVRRGTHSSGYVVTLPQAQELSAVLAAARPWTFLVETVFEVPDSFLGALGVSYLRDPPYSLEFSKLRPDLIQVMPSLSDLGSSEDIPQELRRFHSLSAQIVSPSGAVIPLSSEDRRLRLRLIDIKLTAEASPPYFAELTYYSLVLSAWLQARGLADRFVVVPEAAVWPGSHEASQLVQALRAFERDRPGEVMAAPMLARALADDLEILPIEVFEPKVRRFLQEDVPRVLRVEPWTDLPYHVDPGCANCDFLGDQYMRPGAPYPQPTDALHCWHAARDQEHLSRVVGVTRGAVYALIENDVRRTGDLVGRNPDDPAFQQHHALRLAAAVTPRRAERVMRPDGVTGVIAGAGTSAVMPGWADCRVYLTVDFDPSSAITAAFGIAAIGPELPPAEDGARRFVRINPAAYLVRTKDLIVEREQLKQVLRRIDEFRRASIAVKRNASVQVFLWDSLQYDHFTRVIGRHLDALLLDGDLAKLAWLFPPEELAPNPEHATRQSPLTIVHDAVRALIGSPLPHHYGLLELAARYHTGRPDNPDALFGVPPLFRSPMSDQIPPERIHELWRPGGEDLGTRMATFERVVKTRVRALVNIADRLRADLYGQLDAEAPGWDSVRRPIALQSVAVHSLLLYTHARLNAALDALEKVHLVRAMPPYEREARFASAYLPRRLGGNERREVLRQSGLNPGDTQLLVYELASGSREIRAKEGDFGFALAPRGYPGFLDERLGSLGRRYGFEVPVQETRRAVDRATQVSIVRLDRTNGFVVLRPDTYGQTDLATLEGAGVALDQDVMLDPRVVDIFTPRLEATLRALGNPQSAPLIPGALRALGVTGRVGRGAAGPAAEMLWETARLAGEATARELGDIRADVAAGLARRGEALNESQWAAWSRSLAYRASLVWGPPGTGKSTTVRAIVLGAFLDALRRGRGLRVLVTGNTYIAMDNVLIGAAQLTRERLTELKVARIRSKSQPAPDRNVVPPEWDIPMSAEGEPALDRLLTALRSDTSHVLVGATDQQVQRLCEASAGTALAPLFDLIVIDEGSQMDVAHATLALGSAAPGAALVCAGDPKQLPPIHAATPPLGLDSWVGSIYRYLEDVQGVPSEMLEENYRSNRELVEFTKLAGYRAGLRSVYPNLALRFTNAAPSGEVPPEGWPEWLAWSPGLASLLDPAKPATTFLYREGRSAQSNPFEADIVTAMCVLLNGRLASRLIDDPRGEEARPFAPEDLFRLGVGIVTPHRAQQALIIQRLGQAFTGVRPDILRGAVDTVERFQGQQRDCIMASFGVGDIDAIGGEEEFLWSLARFNVMASRARAKLIVLITRELADHLPQEIETMYDARLLKAFVHRFCNVVQPLQLAGGGRTFAGELRTAQ
jgi:hypothetical protein